MKLRLALLCLLISGCAITRAETNYELNRRAGEPVPSEALEDSLKLHSSSAMPRKPYMPARLPPVVERVWLFDRKIGDYWQQGTWIWLEVEPGRWLNDVDPGGAPLVLGKINSEGIPGLKNTPAPKPDRSSRK